MKTKTLSILLMTSMIFSGVLSGCAKTDSKATSGTDDKKEVKITWMHHFGEEGSRKWIDTATKEFTKKYPNVTFNIVATDGGNYDTLLKTKMASDDMPDMFMIDNVNNSKELIDAGFAEDLTNQDFLKNIQETALPGSTLNGKVYDLPIDTNGIGVTYNKDAFEKAGIKEVPKTYKEFMDVCAKLKAVGITPIGAGYKDKWTIGCDEKADTIQGALKYDQNWKVDLEAGKTKWSDNKAHFKEALKRLGDRFQYVNDDPFGTDWNKATQMLATGKVAMIINGTWTVDAVRSTNKDAKIGLFAFPWSDDPAENKFPLKSTGGIAVNPKSLNKDMCNKMLAFLTTPEMGKVFQDNKKAISVIKGLKLDFDPAFADLQAYIESKNTVNYSSYNPDFVSEEMSNAYTDVETKFLFDKNRDVDKYIKMLDEEFGKIIKAKK